MVSREVIQVIISSVVCLVCILLRGFYRLFYRCRVHNKCHRRWHVDDLWMTFSVLPLLGRALCIAWSNSLLKEHPSAATAPHSSAISLSSKLLLPGRIFYALFLWFMKICLLELYLRISDGLPIYRRVGLVIRLSLYLTFVGVILATLLECRPLHLIWNGDPAGVYCRKARGNLITMAACNMATDIALILFPISLLWKTGLEFWKFLRLAILFALGSLIIITTIIRLPLILRDDAQKTRSLWASIEIACACVVANAPFFHAIIVDMQLGGLHNTSLSSTQRSYSQTSRYKRRSSGAEDDDEIGLWHVERNTSTNTSKGSQPRSRRGSMKLDRDNKSTNTMNISANEIQPV